MWLFSEKRRKTEEIGTIMPAPKIAMEFVMFCGD
jgi:hypothetical protein